MAIHVIHKVLEMTMFLMFFLNHIDYQIELSSFLKTEQSEYLLYLKKELGGHSPIRQPAGENNDPHLGLDDLTLFEN